MAEFCNDLSTLSADTRGFISKRHKLLIGKDWLDSADGGVIAVVDPSSAAEIATVSSATAADVHEAVRAARKAFEAGPWPKLTPARREQLLWRLAELVAANSRQLAEIETLENGKPLRAAQMLAGAAADFLRYMAGWATKIHGLTITPSVPSRDLSFFAYTRPEPVGVVGAIIPWNVPLLMAVWKIGPALASGCTVVLKPAEETPLAALRLGELVLEAGFPEGVVNIITGYGHSAGAALVAHPDVDKIAFTGSTEVGKAIGREAGGRIKRTTLELGGKSPVIVMEDADVGTAVAGAAQAIFANSGQICSAGSRLFVHARRYDDVLGGIVGAAGSLKLGPGLAADTVLGPLVSAAQRDRVLRYIASGTDEGATMLTGGKAIGAPGYYVQPTVFAGASADMKICKEEIFGPVLVVSSFDSIEEVAAKANDTPYGLGASIWGRDIGAIHRLIPRLRAGSVWVNCHNVFDPSLPFGGYKESGVGREMGAEVLSYYTETKTVTIAH